VGMAGFPDLHERDAHRPHGSLLKASGLWFELTRIHRYKVLKIRSPKDTKFRNRRVFKCRVQSLNASGKSFREAFWATPLGLSLTSLTATTAVTFNARERCYNQPAFVSISTY
jgi:hypothetical protein